MAEFCPEKYITEVNLRRVFKWLIYNPCKKLQESTPFDLWGSIGYAAKRLGYDWGGVILVQVGAALWTLPRMSGIW